MQWYKGLKVSNGTGRVKRGGRMGGDREGANTTGLLKSSRESLVL